MKKKFMCLLLTVVLLLGGMSFSIAEAQEGPQYISEGQTVQVGDTFEVPVSIAENPGIISLRFKVLYDMDALELLRVENTALLNGFTTPSPTIASPYTLRWADSLAITNNSAQGTVAVLVFKALQVTDSTEIAIEHGEARNASGEKVSFSNTAVSVVINAIPVAVTGVTLSEKSLSLTAGEETTLTATVSPDNATNPAVTWKSSNPDVAAVDENGKVTAIQKGTAVIQVTTQENGYTDVCTVTVACAHINQVTYPAQASTCITHGHEAYTVCTDCGEILAGSNAELPFAAHRYVEDPQEKYLKTPATCCSEAVYYKSCRDCGAAGSETFSSGDFDYDNHVGGTYIVNARPATCTEEGYTGDVCCQGCNTTLSTGSVIPKSAHTAGDWIQTVAATCTTPGKEERICTECGQVVDSRALPVTEHSFGAWVVTTPATCISEGEETRKCTSCAKTETRAIPKTEHAFGAWTEVKEATCTEAGLKESVCTVCGEKQTETIPALGHTFHAWTVVKEATCTEEGLKESVCTLCGEKQTEVIPKTEHTFHTWAVVKEATCTEEGLKESVCTVCGAKQIESLPALGHQYGEWTVAKEATETEEGLKERVCAVCGSKEVEAIPKLSVLPTTPTDTTSAEKETAAPEIPKTGGTETIIGSAVVLLAVAAGVAILVRKKK